MDIAICVDRLRPKAKWYSASSYADLQRTWVDESQSLPTEEEIIAEWQLYLEELEELSLKKIWTPLDFFTTVLTSQELNDIRQSAKTNDNVGLFYDLAIAARTIETDNPLTIQGLDLLVFYNLITLERKNEILN